MSARLAPTFPLIIPDPIFDVRFIFEGHANATGLVRIDVSHNSGDSKIVFLAFLRLKMPFFDRKSRMCFGGCLPYLQLASWVTPIVIDYA